jgi:hypothetical protein
VQKKWQDAYAEHEKAHPTIILKNLEGQPITDAKGKPIKKDDEPFVEEAAVETKPRGKGKAAATDDEPVADLSGAEEMEEAV